MLFNGMSRKKINMLHFFIRECLFIVQYISTSTVTLKFWLLFNYKMWYCCGSCTIQMIAVVQLLWVGGEIYCFPTWIRICAYLLLVSLLVSYILMTQSDTKEHYNKKPFNSANTNGTLHIKLYVNSLSFSFREMANLGSDLILLGVPSYLLLALLSHQSHWLGGRGLEVRERR